MTCDAALGLYPRTDGTAVGCQMHVQVHVANGWEHAGLLTVVIALALLGAIAIAQFRP